MQKALDRAASLTSPRGLRTLGSKGRGSSDSYSSSNVTATPRKEVTISKLSVTHTSAPDESQATSNECDLLEEQVIYCCSEVMDEKLSHLCDQLKTINACKEFRFLYHFKRVSHGVTNTTSNILKAFLFAIVYTNVFSKRTAFILDCIDEEFMYAAIKHIPYIIKLWKQLRPTRETYMFEWCGSYVSFRRVERCENIESLMKMTLC